MDNFHYINPNATTRDPKYQVNNRFQLLLTSNNISYALFLFYSKFGDTSEPIFQSTPWLTVTIIDLIPLCRQCVHFLCTSSFSGLDCVEYYKYFVLRDRTIHCTESMQFTSTFPTAASLQCYCDTYRRLGVIKDGWLRAVFFLPLCNINRSGRHTLPLQLLRLLLEKHDITSTLLPFDVQRNAAGERIFRATWDTHNYESYTHIVNGDRVIMADI